VSGGRPLVADLHRRFGRGGPSVLERLRAASAEPGGIGPATVARVAGEAGLPAAHVYGAATYYADLRVRRTADHVRVCAGTACFACAGAGGTESIARDARERGRSLQRVRCLGYCFAAPSALVGDDPHAGPDLAAQLAGRAPRRAPEIPVAAAVDDPVTLAGLLGEGPEAWSAWPRALARGGGDVLEEVSRSGLSGRGGAAFPTARKWAAVRDAPSSAPRWVVANGDEGDPGSFADRLLMERDPHRLLEGLALAGLACGAARGVAYVRSEYPAARAALTAAVAEARAAGHLGRDVHGSGWDFDVEVVSGAGSYVAGEETALIAALEGARGGAQVRPPYPAQDGVGRAPTAVNNVETLCSLPWIMARGGDAFARRGVPGSRGTKLASLNERFARPGVYEVELGTPLARICEDLGGGLRDGLALRALQVGGPLGGFVGPEALEVALAHDALRAAGVELGHGGLVAIDAGLPGADLHEHLWGFAAEESCGNCSPCRVGTRTGAELAARLRAEGPRPEILRDLGELLPVVGAASLCGLGRGIAPAVRSLAAVYAEELDPAGLLGGHPEAGP
jgi:NADH-quinone oxidoreductase subunit F